MLTKFFLSLILLFEELVIINKNDPGQIGDFKPMEVISTYTGFTVFVIRFLKVLFRIFSVKKIQ